jgi:hypothetical protein
MKVTIRDLAQRQFVVEIDAQASVADLAEALAAQHQVGSRQSNRLLFNGQLLSTDDPLVACNVHDGASLVVSIDKKAASTIASLPPAFQRAFSRLPAAIRMPLPHEEVHNDECLFSFDNPESTNGIFLPVIPTVVNGTATFYAYGTNATTTRLESIICDISCRCRVCRRSPCSNGLLVVSEHQAHQNCQA